MNAGAVAVRVAEDAVPVVLVVIVAVLCALVVELLELVGARFFGGARNRDGLGGGPAAASHECQERAEGEYARA